MHNEVLLGDCAKTLKKYSDETFDCIITDPPYGYSFMGKQWDKALPSLEALKECCRVLKSGAFAFFMSAPRQDVLSRMIIRLEEAGFQTGFTSLYFCYATGFPKAMNISKTIDKKLGAEREKIKKEYSGNAVYRMEGQNTHTWMEEALKIGYHLSDSNTPVTDEVKALDGSYGGFQPKPATEIIIVCMKPLSEKTYVDQALKNGKGCTWLDECKIPYKDESDVWKETKVKGSNGGEAYGKYSLEGTTKADPNGRFPANLLVSDDVLNDEGKESFSRYFDLDAWFKSKLPEQIQKTYPYLIVPKPAKSEKNKYCENKHPTVKPLKLMSYLIIMGSREGDLILDPFAGSGTTLEAARVLNRKFVGCELTDEYIDVLEARSGVKACPYRNILETIEAQKIYEQSIEVLLNE